MDPATGIRRRRFGAQFMHSARDVIEGSLKIPPSTALNTLVGRRQHTVCPSSANGKYVHVQIRHRPTMTSQRNRLEGVVR